MKVSILINFIIIIIMMMMMMMMITSEPRYDRINKMACPLREDSDYCGHLPWLIRVFALGTDVAKTFKYPVIEQTLIRLIHTLYPKTEFSVPFMAISK